MDFNEIQSMRKPRVGDMIRITRGFTNWNDQMDCFIGRVVRITEIIQDYPVQIRFKGGKPWSWIYEHGHFKIINFKDYQKWLN